MKKYLMVSVLLFSWWPIAGYSEQLSEQLENSIMNKLIGYWHIDDSRVDAQGKWQKGQGASWHFYSILKGHAIQDDWVSPALDQPEPESGRQYGTNIRIFNPKENRWEMAWMSVKGQQVDTFTAVESDDSIVMSGLFGGKASRITFFNITEHNFDWKLEFNQVENNTWVEVYRIKGTRKK